MTLGTNDHEAAKFAHALAQLDVGTAASDISSQSDSTLLAGFFYNCRLTLIVFCIQQLILYALLVKVSGNHFILCNRARTYQHGTSDSVILLNSLRHSA